MYKLRWWVTLLHTLGGQRSDEDTARDFNVLYFPTDANGCSIVHGNWTLARTKLGPSTSLFDSVVVIPAASPSARHQWTVKPCGWVLVDFYDHILASQIPSWQFLVPITPRNSWKRWFPKGNFTSCHADIRMEKPLQQHATVFFKSRSFCTEHFGKTGKSTERSDIWETKRRVGSLGGLRGQSKIENKCIAVQEHVFLPMLSLWSAKGWRASSTLCSSRGCRWL